MILSERENLIQNNRNQLSFIPEEFSEKRYRKKPRSKSLRSNKNEKKKRNSKKYKTQKLGIDDSEEIESNEFYDNRNEGKTVKIKENPIYFNFRKY